MAAISSPFEAAFVLKLVSRLGHPQGAGVGRVIGTGLGFWLEAHGVFPALQTANLRRVGSTTIAADRKKRTPFVEVGFGAGVILQSTEKIWMSTVALTSAGRSASIRGRKLVEVCWACDGHTCQPGRYALALVLCALLHCGISNLTSTCRCDLTFRAWVLAGALDRWVCEVAGAHVALRAGTDLNPHVEAYIAAVAAGSEDPRNLSLEFTAEAVEALRPWFPRKFLQDRSQVKESRVWLARRAAHEAGELVWG